MDLRFDATKEKLVPKKSYVNISMVMWSSLRSWITRSLSMLASA